MATCRVPVRFAVNRPFAGVDHGLHVGRSLRRLISNGKWLLVINDLLTRRAFVVTHLVLSRANSLIHDRQLLGWYRETPQCLLISIVGGDSITAEKSAFRTSMISKVKGKARIFVPRSEGAG